MEENRIIAEVISVLPNKIKISVDDINDFKIAEEKLKIGSYIEVSDNDNCKLMAIIENFSIEIKGNESSERRYILEASPLGIISNGIYRR